MFDTILFACPVVDMIVPLIDQFPIYSDITYPINTIVNEPGGPANILISAKRIGLDIFPIGAVGNDYYGTFLLNQYKREGLDTSGIKILNGFETRKVIVLLDSMGLHSYISMIEGPEGLYDQAKDYLLNTKSICFYGYLAASDSTRDDALKLLTLAEKENLIVFFDPGPLIDKIDPQAMNQILSKSSVVVLNELEAFLISGLSTVEDAANYLIDKVKDIVVVKAGSRGCYIKTFDNRKTGKWYPAFKVKVRDTTAAGDSFLGAFMFGYLSNWDIDIIACFSNAVGAATVEKIGSGTQVATFDDICKVLEKNDIKLSSKLKNYRDFKYLSCK